VPMTERAPRKTPDAIVGSNIRRLRKQKEPDAWSQRTLAARLATITGERGWLDRIVRMEGTEEGPSSQKHRPASWPELISLALALETTLFEIVLPEDDVTQVVVARASQVERGELPDGRPKTKTTSYVHHSDRDELGRLLFGLPGTYLTVEMMHKLSAMAEAGTADAMLDIRQVEEGLEKALETLAEIKNRREST
jgi:hypothetical protein